MICVSISHISQVSKVLQMGAELIELRLDLIKKDPGEIYSLIPERIRSIVTCRPGGVSESDRLQLLKESIDLGASLVDIEIESATQLGPEMTDYAKGNGTEVIFSYHNFQQTPGREELVKLMIKCLELGGDIAKIATQVNTREDIGTLLSLYEVPGRKVVVGMGTMGRITRVVAPYLDAEFTFAAPDEGGETAPGQLSLKQLKNIYNVIDNP